MRPINILQIERPIFQYAGVTYYVEERMYNTFNDFQEEIDRAIDMGYTHCFIHYMGNQHDGKMITDDSGEHTRVFIRSKFLKIKDE